MSPERNLRVLVVDDHEVVQWGFRLLLTQQPWVERCLSASTTEQALELVRRYEPHVALVDLFLGGQSGAELCEAIRSSSAATRVLLISGAGWISPQAARAAGAAGFVPKDWPAPDVARAVLMVGRGGRVFAPRSQQPSTPLSGAGARGAHSDGVGGHESRDRAAPLPLAPHRQGAHQPSIESSRSATAPRPCGGRSGGRTDRLMALPARRDS